MLLFILVLEPPDVKNWFSSYAYESPVLDTSDQFEDSLHLEMEPEKFVVEDSDAETEEKLTIIRKFRSGDEKVDEEKERYSFARHNSSIEVREQKQVCKVHFLYLSISLFQKKIKIVIKEGKHFTYLWKSYFNFRGRVAEN